MEKITENVQQVWLEFHQSVIDHIPKVVLAIIVILLFALIANIIKNLCVKIYKRVFRKNYLNIERIIASMFYALFFAIGIFLALHILGLDKPLEKMLAGAGIIGIIAGFALKDIASNMFSGLLVDVQRPYKVGDWVEIDGKYGVVMDISWLTTKIKTVPGQEVFVPNQIIYNGTFTNFSTWGKRRIILESGVSYGDDLNHVRTVALDEVKKIDELLPEEGIDFYFTKIDSSTYNFMLRYWVKFESNDDFCRGMSDVIMRIKNRFEQENISIAYPVTTLDFGVKGGVSLFDKDINVKT
ncbi:MAG: mechanosensitive ion channel family protein [Flavobacteriaceae bacterium]|jgi:small conductance mechanosensitive channel|uniref:mechanosensitive ion channel family protein n=1 Tax=Flagellimonas TaxID=444459 RepID=UPI0025F481A6|nr:mechanosensitive ion channel family protein [Allomuricauda sp.]MCR9265723.1 mechanosensitive ion channel family protein [Flavobacteriaceae bacterium]